MDNEIAWAAGFIDGEGCICINRIRYHRDKTRWYYQPNISCGQTIKGEVAVRKLQSLFGGYVYRYKEKRNRLDTVTWAVRSRDAERVVNKILPHLVLKNKQAELILRFYEMMELKEKAYRLKDKDFDEREKLFNEMKLLNAIGEAYQKRLSEETSKEEATV